MIYKLMQIPDHVFRGYDLRGVVGPDLDEERMEILGKAYATWLIKRRVYDCVVGYDSRLSSPSFSVSLIKGLTDLGITVYDIGLTLSQICYFAQYCFKTRGMAMITASHNPKEYNGLKLATGFSSTMMTEEIIEFRKLVKSNKFTTHLPKGKHIKYDIFPEYKKDILKKAGEASGFKVVVDSCAATTGLFLPIILKEAGCTVIEQNTKLDGSFPVGVADPTEKQVQERVAKRVLKENADIGFSYDGDGDRIGVVDEKGGLIWNDTLTSLFAKDILDFLPGAKIVYNTLCSKQVDEVIKLSKGIPIMWKTGHSFIKAKVQEERAIFGGELSGHFFFVDNFYGHDDGAISTLRLLNYLKRINKTLSQAVNELPQYISSPEIKVGCPDSVKFQVVSKKIGDEIKKLYPNAKYIEIDGVRMDTEQQMLIIRASQNGPYITIKFEGKTQKQYDILKNQANEILHKFKEIDFSEGVNIDSLK